MASRRVSHGGPLSDRLLESHTAQRHGGPLPGGRGAASGVSLGRVSGPGSAVRVGEPTAVACPGPPALAADQVPAARNRSTTLCGMRPRGETSILLVLAHARTAWVL